MHPAGTSFKRRKLIVKVQNAHFNWEMWFSCEGALKQSLPRASKDNEHTCKMLSLSGQIQQDAVKHPCNKAATVQQRSGMRMADLCHAEIGMRRHSFLSASFDDHSEIPDDDGVCHRWI